VEIQPELSERRVSCDIHALTSGCSEAWHRMSIAGSGGRSVGGIVLVRRVANGRRRALRVLDPCEEWPLLGEVDLVGSFARCAMDELVVVRDEVRGAVQPGPPNRDTSRVTRDATARRRSAPRAEKASRFPTCGLLPWSWRAAC
jgi:hypothetical protein